MDSSDIGLIVIGLIVLFVIISLMRSVRIVPQARAGVVERLGRYSRTLDAGLKVVIPYIDRVRPLIDLREQVVTFPPQPVITEDNLVVSIDTVLYYQVTDPKAATYEIANFIQGIEQLTVTTLRNVIGGMDLEQTLTSREEINRALRLVLDDATGKWGIRVNRVELKAIDPPASIQDSMEKQMRADRDKRAAILTAEGVRQSAVLTAEGDKQSAILRAQGDREAQILRAQAEREAQILRAEGEAQAIGTVFSAIHDGDPDQPLLAYQYLQMLPQIAQGDANKVWIVPSELGKALEGLGGLASQFAGGGAASPGLAPHRPRPSHPRMSEEEAEAADARRKAISSTPNATRIDDAERAAQEAVNAAIAAAEGASGPSGAGSGAAAAVRAAHELVDEQPGAPTHSTAPDRTAPGPTSGAGSGSEELSEADRARAIAERAPYSGLTGAADDPAPGTSG